MKIHLDCIPCFQRQALQASRFVTDDEGMQEGILREVVEVLMATAWDTSPPEMARKVHRIVRERTGIDDPYREVKKEANVAALGMYPDMKDKVESAEDPLMTAVRLAIAGNIIDLGACETYDLEGTIAEVLVKSMKGDGYSRLREALEKANTMIYLADNSGEVVFDRLLIETILKNYQVERIIFVVKGSPIINDATLIEAEEAGLDRIPEVEFAKMGTGVPGSGSVRESKEFGRFLDSTDLVISKGQGNFEGLSHREDIFFLLMAKCPLVASELGAKVGDIILKGGE